MDYRNFERARKVMAESYVKDVRRERRRLANYYKRQRFYGALILLAGALMIVCSYVFFMEFLRYLGLLAGIVGLYVMVTKQMLVMDAYYYELQSRMMLL